MVADKFIGGKLLQLTTGPNGLMVTFGYAHLLDIDPNNTPFAKT
jgi:hypothetical protein